MMHGTREEFHYAQCKNCGSLRLLDAPADMAPYYNAGDYYSFETLERKFGLWDVYRWAKNRAYYLAKARNAPWPSRLNPPLYEEYGCDSFLPTSRILDVGCGSGALLLELRRNGFRRLMGVDPFLPQGINIPGVELVRGGLDDLDREFDVIMMHHSLEHTPDPVAALESARQRLAHDGAVVVRIPIVAGAWDLYGVDWVQLDAPRHVAIFSQAGMAAAAERAGLQIVNSYCDSSSFQFWGSELYRLDIPLADTRVTTSEGLERIFSVDQMAEWAQEADRLNSQMRGDQAVFVLTPDNSVVV